MLGGWLARYAGANVNLVLVASPHNGLGRAERGKKILATSQGLPPNGISRARPRLVHADEAIIDEKEVRDSAPW
jgi:hypothetical protein